MQQKKICKYLGPASVVSLMKTVQGGRSVQNRGECDSSKYRMTQECYTYESWNIMSDIEVMVANLFSTYKGILISMNQYHIYASIGTDSQSFLFMPVVPV